MSFQESGGLSRERPSLVINHFVFAKNGGTALAVPACPLWGALYPNYLGHSIFRTRATLDTTFWPNIMSKNGYKKWPFTYFPALHTLASYPPGNLLLSLWPRSSISGTGLGTPPGGTTLGVKSTHVSQKKPLNLRQKWATSLPVSSVLLPLVVVVLRQVLGGGGSA